MAEGTRDAPTAEAPAGVDSGLRHWRLEREDSGLCRLWADRADSRVNALGEAMLRELEVVVERLEADPPTALVLGSAKPGGFAVGADVHEFVGRHDPEALTRRVRAVQALFDRVERLACPSVAVIHGHCLGGGLELALACRHRVAESDARLGFPEIRLGIHPGFGGTLRATRLMPGPRALALMLTGRTISARHARRLGLVDAVVPARHLDAAARRLAAKGGARPRPGLAVRLGNSAPLRLATAAWARRETARRVRREHYPAPDALIALWRRHGGDPQRLLEAEAASVARLLAGETAQNLVRVFLLRERLRGIGRAASADVGHLHVIGAGAMGGDIAAWCALQGLTVTLQDREPALLGPALRRAGALFDRRLTGAERRQAARDRLIPDPAGWGLGKADLVIEAAPENAELKRALYRTIEPALKPTAVLASNTSSLPLESLATALARPQRLIGLHFFNPVAKMPLVEVVHGRQSDAAALAAGIALVHAIERLALPVRSAPGFLVNRALAPYVLEAAFLVEEGVAPARVDAVARAFGMPMGPLELADQVGLDICRDVAEVLAGGLGGAIPDSLRARVERGELGRKAGRGFYRYKNGKPQGTRAAATDDPAIRDRLILPLLNACLACLDEGIVEDAELVDAGLVFGAGFAPFRGGPLHYLEAAGKETLHRRLAELERRFGARFRASAGWTG